MAWFDGVPCYACARVRIDTNNLLPYSGLVYLLIISTLHTACAHFLSCGLDLSRYSHICTLLFLHKRP